MPTLVHMTLSLAQNQPLGAPPQGHGLYTGLALSLVLLLCFAVVALGLLAFWVWMIIDCATRSFSEPNDKIVWILVIVLFYLVGAVIYFFVGRRRGERHPRHPRGPR